MKLCIYCDYEISVKNEYCYINEDGEHKTEIEEVTKVINGGKLVELIAEELEDMSFSSVSINDDEMVISLFNPMDGTGQDISISIKELQNE